MKHSLKVALISIGLLALLAFITVKLTWLAVIIYLLISVVFFIARASQRRGKAAFTGLLKDLFWGW